MTNDDTSLRAEIEALIPYKVYSDSGTLVDKLEALVTRRQVEELERLDKLPEDKFKYTLEEFHRELHRRIKQLRAVDRG